MNQPRRIQAKQSPVRNTSFSLSYQHRTVGVLESTLETDYFLWRRYELGDETYFKMQPPTIKYDNAKGKRTTYTADGSIKENGIYYIDEVKYLKESLKEENQIKFKILKELFAKKSKVFRVVTEIDIRVGHRIDNIKQLYPAKCHPAPIAEFIELTRGRHFHHLTMKEAIKLCKRRKLPLWVIKRSIAHGLFQTDITKHMSEFELTWSSGFGV